MKSKDLIKLIQDADPSGETHVTVNNQAITDVFGEAGYWDGCGQVIEDDKAYYVTDRKIQVIATSIPSQLLHDPEFPIEYDDYTSKYKERDEQSRKTGKRIDFEVNFGFFEKWAKEKFSEPDNILEFYCSNIEVLEYISKGLEVGSSIIERLHARWDKMVGYSVGELIWEDES